MLRLRVNFKREFTELRTCRSGWTVRCNDKVEQNNGVSLPRQVESRVSKTSSSNFQHCDANRVEYAYFSAPCGS